MVKVGRVTGKVIKKQGGIRGGKGGIYIERSVIVNREKGRMIERVEFIGVDRRGEKMPKKLENCLVVREDPSKFMINKV